ncbi:hypothetical protein HPB48_024977 [Haemaphysalis longicornis]|uniref:CCHC-type domain-containing protein n=1 Tax=Haemaphysalis longicornis TaxID=44386 RepID=A0A9J6H881_HAELO|nr:hypothetical protein HPB48_024977 [Haemaphysalis longicornis]
MTLPRLVLVLAAAPCQLIIRMFDACRGGKYLAGLTHAESRFWGPGGAVPATGTNNPVITVRDQDARFDYRGSQAKVIKVLHYPNDQPDEALCCALGSFGQVHSCSKGVSGFPGVWSGVRRMREDMSRAVPNFVSVGRFTMQCEYEGVVRLCIRCGLPGHYAAVCTTPKCKRCDRFGHEQCEAPCTKCAGDHAVSECTFRSFAMVTQQPPPPAGVAGTSVAPVQQDSSSSIQASGAGSMESEGDGGCSETLRAVREDQLAATPPKQSVPADAAATEDQAEEELVEVMQSVEEAPKSARRKRPRHKRKSHTLAAGTSANDGSEDELSRSSRDTPKEKRAVDGNESSGDEGSSSSEEMSADSFSSESGDAIENPVSPESSSPGSIYIRLPAD